jgi:hypothetical protein
MSYAFPELQPLMSPSGDMQFARHFAADEESEAYSREAYDRVLAEIRRLNLEAKAWELEAQGFTVVEPERVANPDFVERLRESVVQSVRSREGDAFNLASDTGNGYPKAPFGQVFMQVGFLMDGAIYEQALMNEQVLALITYLLGESCVVNHLSGMVKGPGPDALPLHTDQNISGAPPPFPAFAQVANATWLLTDYSSENGCTCFVPGSHRWCRPPTRHEALDLSMAVPIEAKAGSVMIWHGNTWHGAYPRTVPGERVSLVTYYNRRYHHMIEPDMMHLYELLPAEALERNPDRFNVLVGRQARQGWEGKAGAVAIKASQFGLFA